MVLAKNDSTGNRVVVGMMVVVVDVMLIVMTVVTVVLIVLIIITLNCYFLEKRIVLS